MKLKVKFLRWSAGLPVAILHKDTAAKMGVHTKGRVSLNTISGPKKSLSTIINTSENHLVRKNEIVLSSEIHQILKIKNGQLLDVNLAQTIPSLENIRKKMNGKKLSKKEIDSIIHDIVQNRLSESETVLFISSMYEHGMTLRETIFLIEAILKYGKIFNLKKNFVSDKHSIGGVPGNRTTPLVVSICAAEGLIMPKSSSKAITSAAGTADVIEVLAPVEFTTKELRKILKKTNAFMVWGGAMEMAPADDKIIRIEQELKVDPDAQLLASIMSKKLAVDSDYILIDIPYGKGAKVTKKKALELKKKFEFLGKHFKKKLKVVLTEGDQPIGNGIGPVLEILDIIKILDPKQDGPKDLENKAVFLAGQLLEMTGKAKKDSGEKKARESLESGKAFEKFKEIIKAQGGSLNRALTLGKFRHNIKSKKTGKVIEINNKMINSLARVAGCPVDKSSGIYLYYHKGDKIKKGDVLLTIYAESKPRLKSAIKFYRAGNIIRIK